MKINITELGSVFAYTSDRKSWKNTAPRKHYILAYQLSGHYDHTFPHAELSFRADTLVFINRTDTYTVKNYETGNSICVTFATDTDIPTMAIDCADDPRVVGLFKKLLRFENLEKGGNYCRALSCIYEILAIIAEKSEKEYIGRHSADKLEAAKGYILANYREGTVKSAELAAMCGVSTKYFRTLFKKQYGTTPTQYIIDLKLKKAAELLSDGGFSVSEAAAAVGFDDVCYFSKLFKKRFLCPPRAFGQVKNT